MKYIILKTMLFSSFLSITGNCYAASNNVAIANSMLAGNQIVVHFNWTYKHGIVPNTTTCPGTWSGCMIAGQKYTLTYNSSAKEWTCTGISANHQTNITSTYPSGNHGLPENNRLACWGIWFVWDGLNAVYDWDNGRVGTIIKY